MFKADSSPIALPNNLFTCKIFSSSDFAFNNSTACGEVSVAGLSGGAAPFLAPAAAPLAGAALPMTVFLTATGAGAFFPFMACVVPALIDAIVC